MTIASGERILPEDVNSMSFFPKGTILIYDGTGWEDNKTIPGWYQCNGQNGTPDLTDRFIIGSLAKGQTGGTNTQTLTLDNMPAHTHSLTGVGSVQSSLGNYTTSWFQTDYSQLGSGNSSNVTRETRVGKSDSGFGNDTCAQNVLKLRHKHNPVTVMAETGQSQPFDNRPQYYKVIYIKKVV
ncbi:MAG: hypothetical protein LBD99_06725 [Candidatus Margulisbacteria bacterium]|jgi:microcystin-dependent protein|nr:hypothetical protein [Candidatus Margulisiibacteriota bacterium]